VEKGSEKKALCPLNFKNRIVTLKTHHLLLLLPRTIEATEEEDLVHLEMAVNSFFLMTTNLFPSV
jgi:hypothetical protein